MRASGDCRERRSVVRAAVRRGAAASYAGPPRCAPRAATVPSRTRCPPSGREAAGSCAGRRGSRGRSTSAARRHRSACRAGSTRSNRGRRACRGGAPRAKASSPRGPWRGAPRPRLPLRPRRRMPGARSSTRPPSPSGRGRSSAAPLPARADRDHARWRRAARRTRLSTSRAAPRHRPTPRRRGRDRAGRPAASPAVRSGCASVPRHRRRVSRAAWPAMLRARRAGGRHRRSRTHRRGRHRGLGLPPGEGRRDAGTPWRPAAPRG